MKRWTFRLLNCLILGAVTTTSVAWVLLITAQVGIPTSVLIGPTKTLDQPYWSAHPSLPESDYVILIESSPTYIAHPDFSWEEYKSLVPSWCIASSIPTEEDVALDPIISEAAAGWPLMSNFYRLRHVNGRNVSSMFDLLSFDGELEHAVPFRPIWPGFAVNVLLYTTVWFGIIQTFSSAKGKLRKMKGHCPVCKYDLRSDLESGSPECGWNRE